MKKDCKATQELFAALSCESQKNYTQALVHYDNAYALRFERYMLLNGEKKEIESGRLENLEEMKAEVMKAQYLNDASHSSNRGLTE